MSCRARMTLLGLLLLAGIFPATAQDQPPMVVPTDADTSVAAAREVLVQLRSAAEALLERRGGSARDGRGRTIGEDVAEWVLPAADLQEIESLMAAAKQRDGDEDTPGGATPVIPLIVTQWWRLTLIDTYWKGQEFLTHHQRLLGPLLGDAPDADLIRAHVQGTLRTSQQLLERGLRLQEFPERSRLMKHLTEIHTSAVAYYNQRRGTLAQLGTPLPVQPFQRGLPCPEPRPSPPAADGNPGILEAPDTEEYYPPSAKSHEVAGSVVVRVALSETGCLELAGVQVSSGDPALDAGALRFAQAIHYRPQVHEGQATPAEYTFRVTFQLRD